MYCTKCGKEIDDKAVICVGCGAPTHGDDIKEAKQKSNKHLIIIGVIIALIILASGIAQEVPGTDNIMYVLITGLVVVGILWAVIRAMTISNKQNLENAKRRAHEKPSCPRCGSEYISIGKGDTDALAGCLLALIYLPLILFANNTQTQARCGNCGHKWIVR